MTRKYTRKQTFKTYGFQKGNKNSNWKGGIIKNNNYTMILIDGKYIYRHIHNFEQFYKCKMLKWGHVHHIIPVKQGGSDDIENLQGMTNPQHQSLHRKIDYSGVICLFCHNKTCVKTNGQPRWYRHENGFICKRCYDRLNSKRKKDKK